MFIDEKTNVQIHADLNTTITNSPRIQDLIPAFLEVIRDTAEYAQLMVSGGGIPAHALEDEEAEWSCFDLEETLFGVLDEYSPEGYYFGDRADDETNFGYWKCD